MIHVKWSSPNFKVDLDHENDNIMKNGFYQRILQPSEYPKRVGAKKNFFFQTLLDGPFVNTLKSHFEIFTFYFLNEFWFEFVQFRHALLWSQI